MGRRLFAGLIGPDPINIPISLLCSKKRNQPRNDRVSEKMIGIHSKYIDRGRGRALWRLSCSSCTASEISAPLNRSLVGLELGQALTSFARRDVCEIRRRGK